MCLEERKGENSKLTQRQLNALFEGPPLDMAQRYANTMLLFCLTVFFAFPMPIVSLIALGGTIFQYWVDKWVLLRRHKIPEQMGSTMADVFINAFPLLCFLYGISIFVFSNELSGGRSYVGLAAIVLTIIYLFLPIRSVINKCTRGVFRSDSKEYKNHYFTFLTDYNRANPMSQKEANLDFLSKMANDGKLDKDEVEKRMKAFMQGGKFGGVMTYGQNSSNMQNRAVNTYGFAAQPAYGYGQYNAYYQRGYAQPAYGYAAQPFYRPVVVPTAYSNPVQQYAAPVQQFARPVVVPQPTYSYQQPVYQQPVYQQPVYQQPVYQQQYQQPTYYQPQVPSVVANNTYAR